MISALSKGSKSPLDVFAATDNNLKKEKKFSTIFGEDVVPLGIRLSPRDAVIDEPNWFEYRIEPLISQPKNLYHISLIFRNQDTNPVIESIKNFERLSQNVIEVLEFGSSDGKK